MKFYDRKTELENLDLTRVRSMENSSFTVLIGRRRIGKTALLLRSVKNQKHLYLFVSRNTEPLLCAQFQKEAEAALGLRIFGAISRFRDLFEQLLLFAEKEHYTLIIDEFQELERVNPAIFSDIQNLWDRYKDSIKINFLVCGSIYSMMIRIFENSKEPLFGRLNSKITLRPFTISVIKKILGDYNPEYTQEDMLCLYMLTGGIPRYIGQLLDAGAVDTGKMLDAIIHPDSPFLNEGKELLISEFGKEYGTYFSILQLIARGMTTQSEVDSVIGKNTGAYLSILEKEYSLITKNRPLFSKPESRNARWKISDQYLRFWFRFIYPNQSLIETGRSLLLKKLILKDYETYSGPVLEDYFRNKIMENSAVSGMGAWWDKKGENEIDIVTLNDLDKTATVIEVKRNLKKISIPLLITKAEKIAEKLSGYKIEYKGLSLKDM
ncbi:putative ATPase [Treponema primitia ZAS-2]|uniref:Putative ATPase n=1 Tax=Treponema primitia (strain ATCC BAA-887 / DSM 12427 / ZAS-2) TaxID=545694 RepID=F5YIY3_TREPZ|nr:ATP-binding protein [Treponema primitia]AEF83712.1 putative ATPase [Treponema primitia ZAS-2]